ncbi:MAG: tetraacyldisaccharide 4'-kinase [Chlorobium sp.]|jgi:tetraacyldisaccharide 4'-kinase|nr:tetraacyldisaccharide 4'-kinase [Chlorobium sp.]
MPFDLSDIILRPASLLYKNIIRIRNRLYDQQIFHTWHSPLPVVSIGNISAGGTGKTPLVDWIVKYYLSLGCKPAIVSRGYGRNTTGVQLVSDGKTVLMKSNACGDETAMLAWNNRDAIVIVAEKRKDAVAFIIRRFAEAMPDVIILDDAFQHRQIARNLDIVVINEKEPYFRADMIPKGRLREPLTNLARADLLVLSKITGGSTTAAISMDLEQTGKPVIKTRTAAGNLVCLSGMFNTAKESPVHAGIKALAFAGIGSPQSFIDTLEGQGIQIVSHRFFRDHESYTAKKIAALRLEADEKKLTLVTTEKDYFRMLGQPELQEILHTLSCCYLKIRPEFTEGEKLLKTMLNAVVNR